MESYFLHIDIMTTSTEVMVLDPQSRGMNAKIAVFKTAATSLLSFDLVISRRSHGVGSPIYRHES